MLRMKSAIAAVACVVLTVSFASVSLADDAPIDSLYGTWAVSCGGIWGNLGNGAVAKQKALATWVMTPAGGNNVQISGLVDGPPTIIARYEYGVLFLGDFSEEPPAACTGYAIIKGTPGKLSLQGQIISANAQLEVLNNDTLKGKWISSATMPPGANGPKVVSVEKGVVTPPPIENLYDTYWIVKTSGGGYEFWSDEAFKNKGTMYWHMRQGADTDSLIVDSTDLQESEQLEMQYFHGILIMADGSGPAPATDAQCAYLLVSGSAGKMKLAGAYLGYEIGGSEDQIEGEKVTGKQSLVPVP